MASGSAQVQAQFHEQARLCTEYGSPFTGQLIERLAADLEAGGVVAELLVDWLGAARTEPRSPLASDAVAIRICGALHAAVLSERDPALGAEYPAQRPDWRMDAVWPLAQALLTREHAWVTQFIVSAPQTNEVRRSIALLPGFLRFAHMVNGPIDTLEIGASAGLNLYWDRFRYRTASWTWGASDGLALDTEWSGPLPQLAAAPQIRSRAACDLNPLNVADAAQRLQLRSYIWADQRERLERFDAAVELALANAVRVERADAADWLARRLAEPTDCARIVYHSVFLQYPPRASREAIEGAISSAGKRATPSAPLAWLRLEPEAVLGGPRSSLRFLVDMVTWPGPVQRVLAVTDGHARAVEALP